MGEAIVQFSYNHINHKLLLYTHFIEKLSKYAKNKL